MDLVFDVDNKRLNIRAGILIECDNKFLVINDGHAKYDYLIGGRIHFFESSSDAIIREVKEELDIEIEHPKLIFTYEFRFLEETLNKFYHEFGFVYYLKLESNHFLNKQKETKRENLRFLWKSINDPVQPQPIFDYIKLNGIPESVVHLVSKEIE